MPVIITALVIWVLASVPVGLLVGAVLRSADRAATGQPTAPAAVAYTTAA
jgi:hypothetical protein